MEMEWKGANMNRKHLSLSAVLLAGTFVGIAPAWSAGSSSFSSSDQSQPGSMRLSSGSSSTDSGNATDSGSSTSSGTMRRRSGGMARQGNVKQVQEALKDKGFDPGPIDGVMGQKTQEALRSFQQSKNIKVTGRLDSETAQQLGVGSSTSGSSSSTRSSSRSNSDMGASGGAPTSNTNTGTSDSPSSDTSNMPAGSTRGSNTGSGH